MDIFWCESRWGLGGLKEIHDVLDTGGMNAQNQLYKCSHGVFIFRISLLEVFLDKYHLIRSSGK